MSRDGSGNYSLPAGNPVVTGTTASSSVHNSTLSDIASALTASLAKDGQTVPTANLPMGGFKHTGVGNAAATTQYASAAQVISSSLTYLGSVSGTDTITASATIAPAAYAAGQSFRFIVGTTNTGAATLNVNSLGAKDVKKRGSTGLVALVAGDLVAGHITEVVYDGTQFQLIGALPHTEGAAVASDATVVLDTATGDFVHITGTTTITAVTLAQGRQAVAVFDGALTFTHGSSLILPGAANITTAAGDVAVLRGEGSSVTRCILYQRAAVVPPTANLCRIATGTYTGDGATSKAITGVGFAPKYVRITARVTTDGATMSVLETTDVMIDDNASGMTTNHAGAGGHASRINAIISLDADGFTVDDAGTDSLPNSDGTVYNYLCLG